MTSFGEQSADDRPELADVGRLARKLVNRAVRTARAEDQPLRRVLLDHLGPDAATLPTVSDTCPLYEQVNLQIGLDAWLAGPGREHEAIGITGVPQMRFNDVTIGDFIQATSGSMYGSAGVGAPVAMNLPCGPDGQTMPCVTNGIYLVREGAERLAIMFRPSGMGMRHTGMNLQVIGANLRRAETVLGEIRTLANERSVLRGQVISFGPDVLGPGVGSTPLSFLPRTTVTRDDQLVLPAELLSDIERQVIGVAAHSRRLIASGQHLKRGVLLYGTPGTGKTHTVRYLLGLLPEMTVIAISGRALGRIREACSVARTLQPAVVVLAQAHLLRRQRSRLRRSYISRRRHGERSLSGEFKKSSATFHNLSPELNMSLWPTPERLTSRARLPMAVANLLAIQGRVSASAEPLMISVGQLILPALERALNGPIGNAALPR